MGLQTEGTILDSITGFQGKQKDGIWTHLFDPISDREPGGTHERVFNQFYWLSEQLLKQYGHSSQELALCKLYDRLAKITKSATP